MQGLGDVLGRLAPDRAPQEERVAVLPLVGLLVEEARRGGHGEVRDRSPRRGEAQVRVVGQVSDDGDRGLARHGQPPKQTCGSVVIKTVSMKGQWTSGRSTLVRM